MNRYLNKEKSLEFIEVLKSGNINYAYDIQKHRVVVFDEYNNERLFFRLPVNICDPDNLQQTVQYVILIVQSGSCAVGYFEDEKNKDHKVFGAYMVRKKQGKSQVKYLKTKGKSRAGSRVRLASTNLFFENINTRLQEYFKQHRIDRIAFSCSKILIPYLFNAKIPCPFEKSDDRIVKIPRHIHTPNFEAMTDIHKFLLKGEIIYEDDDQDFVNSLGVV